MNDNMVAGFARNGDRLKVLMLTREYPPHIYGGAGVHVEQLTRELARLAHVEVRCFGDQQQHGGNGRACVRGFESWAAAMQDIDPRLRKAVEPLTVDLAMAGAPVDADVVHCHTWYSNMAGLWVKLLYGVPLVVTTHSLEPLRPWKEEQLGRGYALSSWIERTAIEAADAIIAVSEGTRREVLECYRVDPARVRVIYNGVDLDVFRRVDPVPVLAKHGLRQGRPYILFVGRITRQKGVLHLLRALRSVTSELDVVLCAGSPDTPAIAAEMEAAVRDLQRRRPGVHWIREWIPVSDLVGLYSGAGMFVCPSIYEPFGLINVEAMAVGCPIVASRVGGIPEVVSNNETGVLVPFESRPSPDFEPRDPQRFSADIAAAINRLWRDERARRRMVAAGRQRVEERFSWTRIASQTHDLYESVCRAPAPHVNGSLAHAAVPAP